MVTDRRTLLRGAWKQASADFSPAGKRRRLGAGALEAEARSWLAKVFPGPPVPFALPADLAWWIEEVAQVGWHDDPQHPWRSFYAAHAIVSASEEARYVSSPPENRTAWLAIGRWSERHVYLVCCDPTDPRFGQVADYHDTHPWSSTTQEAEETWADLLSFIASLEVEEEEEELW